MSKQSEPVAVTPRILEALETIRRSGLTNMLDRRAVATLAEQLGYPDAATWIRTHRDEYGKGIFHGFSADEAERP